MRSGSVTVDVTPAPPPTLTLSVTPELAKRGGDITVSWSSTHTLSCYWSSWPILGGATSDTRTLHIDERIVATELPFEIECDSYQGSVTKVAFVRIQSLGGTLHLPVAMLSDDDVNDPDAPYRSGNDDLAIGQGVESYTRIAGYLNEPQAGPPGRSYAAGDPRDVYWADFRANQTVRLILPTVDESAPDSSADADLYLWTPDGVLVDAAISSANREALRVPGEGRYLVEVRLVRGALTYLLALDDEGSPAILSANRLSADFVEGEAIVRMKSAAATSALLKPGATLNGFERKAGSPEREMLAHLGATSIARSKSRAAVSQPAHGKVGSDTKLAKLATLLEIKQLSQRTDVEAATPNLRMAALAEPPDPLYAKQRWHYALAKVPGTWDLVTGSSAVTVAIVDSGVVRNHPDLKTTLIDGYDFVSKTNGLDGNGIDADYEDPGVNIDGRWLFHGTHVAGTVGAAAHNGEGGVGVAYGVRLMPLRALDGASGTEYDVLQAVRYAAQMPNDSGRLPTVRADVINLSLGSDGTCSGPTATVIHQAITAGTVVVASAGNDGVPYPMSPSSCPEVISVGAATAYGNMTAYSNYGPYVSLIAPGGMIDADWDGDGRMDGIFSTFAERSGTLVTPTYESLEGTSMAAAHASGVIALMKSAKPSLTPQAVNQMLESNYLTTNPNGSSRGDEGYGLLNALSAVEATLGNFPIGARIGFSRRSIDLSLFGSASLDVFNAGSGSLTITGITPLVPWLQMTAVNVDANGLGLYEVRNSSGTWPRGLLSGGIEVASNAGPATLQVTVSNLSRSNRSFPGRLYVRAVDADTHEILGELANGNILSNGTWSYMFKDVPPGRRVYVIAGTDLNHDGNLCDPGEVCEIYPKASLPSVIAYDGVRVGVDATLRVTAFDALR